MPWKPIDSYLTSNVSRSLALIQSYKCLMTRSYTTYMLPTNVCHMFERQIITWKFKPIFHKLEVKWKWKYPWVVPLRTTSKNKKRTKNSQIIFLGTSLEMFSQLYIYICLSMHALIYCLKFILDFFLLLKICSPN